MNQINDSKVLLHVASGNRLDPTWDGSAEQTHLEFPHIAFLFDFEHNAVNVFLKAEFQHLVCLVKNKGF